MRVCGYVAFTALALAIVPVGQALSADPEKGDSPHLPERPATNLRSVPGFAQMGTVPFFVAVWLGAMAPQCPVITEKKAPLCE
jgi:hypothetical protein